jgi:hypothetical protein
VKVCITAGVSKKNEDFDWDDFAADYCFFAEHNLDALVYDIDADGCPLPVRTEVRRILGDFPNSVIFPMEGEDLDELAREYEHIGINARLNKSKHITDLRRIRSKLYASNITSPTTLRDGRFVATTSFAWLSARKYGELWIWSRNKLVHYSDDNRAKGVKAHTKEIEALGVDPLACLQNDTNSLVTVAVSSMLMMEQFVSGRTRDVKAVAATSENIVSADPLAKELFGPAITVQNSDLVPVRERQRVTLPVISIEDQDGKQIVRSNADSLRQCNSCYIRNDCPRFEDSASCAFSLPVTISTARDWELVGAALLEIQAKRIMFGHFADEVSGEGPSARVGQEMDRWFKMVANLKESMVPIPMAGEGALSKAFGEMPAELMGGFGATEEEGSYDEEDDFEEGVVVDRVASVG